MFATVGTRTPDGGSASLKERHNTKTSDRQQNAMKRALTKLGGQEAVDAMRKTWDDLKESKEGDKMLVADGMILYIFLFLHCRII